MSRCGNCWNNAVTAKEGFGLKKKQIKKRIYKTREMTTTEIDE
jgi:putative transposase